MDPDRTARMRRLVWIHAGRNSIVLVLSWHGSNDVSKYRIVTGSIPKAVSEVTHKKCSNIKIIKKTH
jgi:hypothetical protein